MNINAFFSYEGEHSISLILIIHCKDISIMIMQPNIKKGISWF